MGKVIRILLIVLVVLFTLVFIGFCSVRMAMAHGPGEDAYYKMQYEKIKDEPVLVRQVFNGIRDLPTWARDFDAVLSFPETLKLFFLSNLGETEARQYLPQVRSNLKRYHLPLSGDENLADYVEQRFRAAGLMEARPSDMESEGSSIHPVKNDTDYDLGQINTSAYDYFTSNMNLSEESAEAIVNLAFSAMKEVDDDIADYAESSLKGLPYWARDPEVELSREETLNLLEEVKENDTLVRILLPQVRRNAERYGLALPLDSTEVRKLSYYVEQEFIERGLMDAV